MSGYILELLLGFTIVWGGLVAYFKRQSVELSRRDLLIQPLPPVVPACLAGITAVTATASLSFHLAVLWLSFAVYLVLMVVIARRMPDYSVRSTDQFDAPPPLLWVRCRASAIASFLCFTTGCVLLFILTKSWHLSDIATTLDPIIKSSQAIGGPSQKVLALRVSVVLILVGTGLATYTSPLHVATYEALMQWPGAVAGWWITSSRLLGLILIWRLVQTTFLGLESVLIGVMFAVGALSLLHGVSSLWQPNSLRSLLGRWLLVQSGLCWMLMASDLAKAPAIHGASMRFASGFDGLVGIWWTSSLTLWVMLAAEQWGLPNLHRLESLNSSEDLPPISPFARKTLQLGLLSMSLIPPMPQAWFTLSLLLNAFMPGSLIDEHATLMPHPVVMVGMGLGLLAMAAVTMRVLGLLLRGRDSTSHRVDYSLSDEV